MAENDQIRQQLFNAIVAVIGDKAAVMSDDTPLIGDGSVLDSMKLVELCVTLEDMAVELNFEFDWTSAAAMSKSRSMFRSAGALAAEFIAQMENKK